MEVAAREAPVTASDHEWVQKRVFALAGIVIGPEKRDLVANRLARRLRALGLPTVAAYREFVEGPSGGAELEQLTNAFTTNVTAFFREPHHFERLAAEVVPWARARARRLRVWSAACSSGEEPYSAAFAILEAIGKEPSWDVRILATDLDTEILRRAKSAIYPMGQLDGVERGRLARFFLRGVRSNAGKVKVRPVATELVSFARLNLLEKWPMKGPFDVIFCRNVMIYFDAKTQASLVERFASILSPGGYLFIGHSETASDARLTALGKSAYRKVGAR